MLQQSLSGSVLYADTAARAKLAVLAAWHPDGGGLVCLLYQFYQSSTSDHVLDNYDSA